MKSLIPSYAGENMKSSLDDWDVPPLIVEYRAESFFVNDGRHRLEMFRQLGAQNVDVVLWTTGEDNIRKLREVLR